MSSFLLKFWFGSRRIPSGTPRDCTVMFLENFLVVGDGVPSWHAAWIIFSSGLVSKIEEFVVVCIGQLLCSRIQVRHICLHVEKQYCTGSVPFPAGKQFSVWL